jgi:hypothetical protein
MRNSARQDGSDEGAGHNRGPHRDGESQGCSLCGNEGNHDVGKTIGSWFWLGIGIVHDAASSGWSCEHELCFGWLDDGERLRDPTERGRDL